MTDTPKITVPAGVIEMRRRAPADVARLFFDFVKDAIAEAAPEERQVLIEEVAHWCRGGWSVVADDSVSVITPHTWVLLPGTNYEVLIEADENTVVHTRLRQENTDA